MPSRDLAWPLPLVAIAGALFAMVTTGHSHEIGFLVFGVAWIALGATMVGRGTSVRAAAGSHFRRPLAAAAILGAITVFGVAL